MMEIRVTNGRMAMPVWQNIVALERCQEIVEETPSGRSGGSCHHSWLSAFEVDPPLGTITFYPGLPRVYEEKHAEFEKISHIFEEFRYDA